MFCFVCFFFFWYAGVTTDKENKRVSCAAVVASCVAFPRNVRLEFFKCYEEYHFFILFYRSTYLHILYMYWHIESYLHRNLEQIQRLSFDAQVSPTSNEFTIAHRIGRKKRRFCSLLRSFKSGNMHLFFQLEKDKKQR